MKDVLNLLLKDTELLLSGLRCLLRIEMLGYFSSVYSAARRLARSMNSSIIDIVGRKRARGGLLVVL